MMIQIVKGSLVVEERSVVLGLAQIWILMRITVDPAATNVLQVLTVKGEYVQGLNVLLMEIVLIILALKLLTIIAQPTS